MKLIPGLWVVDPCDATEIAQVVRAGYEGVGSRDGPMNPSRQGGQQGAARLIFDVSKGAVR